ncbi:MAG: UbiA family prenyltransferase [Pseudomonadota bacterium]
MTISAIASAISRSGPPGRHAYTVGRAQRLSVSAGGEVKPLGGPGPRGAWLRAIRPHQWLKNALIAVPMLTAFQLEATTLAMVLVAFVCFSLTASSVYLINDLLDLADDRRHPRKSKRPFAAGDLGIRDGLFLAAGLIVSAFSLALAAMPLGFIAVLGIYYAATFAYSLALKRRSVLDVCTLAGLYSMRVIAGGVATGIHLSPWLLAFSMFIFLSLAAVKRQAEMTDLLNTDPTRKTGRPYEVEDLPVIRSIAMSAGYASVLVMALYVNSSEAISRLAVPEAIWLICPLLLYWVTRMVLVTHRGQMTDDPIVFAIRDRTSTVVVLLMVAAAALARVGW